MEPTVVLIVSAGVASLGSLVTAVAARYAGSRVNRELPKSTADDRVRALRSNLDASSHLIKEINAEFELQVAAAERIKAEAEENQKLAALNKDEAEAVRKLVAQTVEGAQARATKLGGRQQWLFFLAGLLAAVPLGVAGNFAFELVKTWLAG